MKNHLLILLFVFIGATAMHPLVAQTYDPYAVQVINNLIANNGLNAIPNAPETWEFATWNNENPKQIVELHLSAHHTGVRMKGNASFAGLTTLQKLGIMYNELDKIDVTNCIQLRLFASRDNRLTEIDLTTCTQLQILTCTNNPYMSSLNLTNCTQLEGLECQGNKLTKLDVTNCTQLQYLFCGYNELIELDLRGLDKLTELAGGQQYPHITLYKNEAEEYTCPISLNNPTFGNSAISYSDGILKSTDKNVTYTQFTVQTTKEGFELSGVMYLYYSNVGIDTIDEDRLKIYPNPNTGELTITNYELQIMSVEVFDVNGRRQKAESRKQKAESEIVIDISHLPSGVYFVKVATEQGDIVKKIVKQ